MRKNSSVILACAVAGIVSGLTSRANAQQTFVDNFNNGNFANSDTIPGFFSSMHYSAADSAYVTEPVGGPMTLGYGVGDYTQGGPTIFSNVTNDFNLSTAPVQITMTAAPGGNLMPDYDRPQDVTLDPTAVTYFSIGDLSGGARPDYGNFRATLEVSASNTPQLVLRDGGAHVAFHYKLYPTTASNMPQGTAVGPGFDVTSMFLYIDGSQAAAGHLFVNFGETWEDTRGSTITYGTYTFGERVGFTPYYDMPNSPYFLSTPQQFVSGYTSGASIAAEVENTANNWYSGEAVPVGQLTDLTTYIWGNAGGSGDGHTWDAGTNANWVNQAIVTSPSNSTTTYIDGPTSAVQFNDENNHNYAVTLNTTVNPGAVLVSNNFGNYTISGTGKIIDAGQFTKNGAGTLTLGVGLTTPNLTITGGGFSGTGATYTSPGAILTGSKMVLAPGVAGGTGPAATSAITVGALNIVGTTSQLDITNNHIIVNYGSGADPIASIVAYLNAGYNGGHWNGASGIITSAPLTVGGLSYGIGYADSADPGNPAHLASGTLEVAYTLLGDADLNGIVNGLDFGILAANFNKGVTGWDAGDFDYNNIVNGIDFGDLAANFNKGVSGASVGVPAYDDPALVAFAQANGLLSEVPEPASLGLLAVGATAFLKRRRRSS